MNHMVNIFLAFYDKIKFYSVLGIKETKYANLIGKAPHIGKEAWLHAIYKPITDKEVSEIKAHLCIEMPKVYENFLKVCNGFSIYGTTLSLYGYKHNYIRDLENIWQPFDIVNANNRERPIDAESNHFFFGSYDWDGSKMYINTNTLKIYRCLRECIKPLNEWENFNDMLQSEANRFKKLFDEKGIEINENVPTIPPLPSESLRVVN
jgi:SMI1 / KNR4 family (SUKH-1)